MIRFRASKPIGNDAGSGLETQALVSQRVALELNDRLQGFQRAAILPPNQTCDLIILDRWLPLCLPQPLMRHSFFCLVDCDYHSFGVVQCRMVGRVDIV